MKGQNDFDVFNHMQFRAASAAFIFSSMIIILFFNFVIINSRPDFAEAAAKASDLTNIDPVAVADANNDLDGMDAMGLDTVAVADANNDADGMGLDDSDEDSD